MFTQMFPVLKGLGVLDPTYTDLVIDEVYYVDAAAAANKLMQFDVSLSSSVSYLPHVLDSVTGVTLPDGRVQYASDYAFGRLVNVQPSTAQRKITETAVYGVSMAAQAAGSLGRVRIVGMVTMTCIALNHAGDAVAAVGDDWVASTATPGSLVAVGPNVGTHPADANPLTVTIHLRKVLLKNTVQVADAATSVTGMFNGFGWGFVYFDTGFSTDMQ